MLLKNLGLFSFFFAMIMFIQLLSFSASWLIDWFFLLFWFFFCYFLLWLLFCGTLALVQKRPLKMLRSCLRLSVQICRGARAQKMELGRQTARIRKAGNDGEDDSENKKDGDRRQRRRRWEERQSDQEGHFAILIAMGSTATPLQYFVWNGGSGFFYKYFPIIRLFNFLFYSL